jgi:hypothetical protein
MRPWKKVLIGIGILLVALIGMFVVFVGPWPTYSSSFEGTRYFNDAMAAIDKNVQPSKITNTPGRLKAGWGVAPVTPAIGVPLAGYGARRGKPSTGVHDDLFVKALAFSDGEDTAVVAGADILLVPPNVADLIRREVAEQTPLTANNLFFTGSHTHDGPGGLAPGLVARAAFGKYDPTIPPFLAHRFAMAIIEAYRTLEPAKMAHGGVNAEQYIHNRTRKGPVDPELSYLVVEKENGKRCYLVSYSAHPTILDDDNMQFSAEYPGYLQRAIETATGAMAVYLGGAVGSMGPHPPDAPDRFTKCQLMGEALAKLVLDNTQNLQWETNVDVVSIGIGFNLPSPQVRLFSPKWRLSPLLGRLAGLTGRGWMQAVRVGDVVFVNAPGDFSGEISVSWKQWAASKGYDLWVSGFSGEYAGYISPDKYYNEVTDQRGRTEYETGLMSWTGPHQEAFFTALMRHMVEVMGKSPGVQPAPQGAPAIVDAKPVPVY